MSNTKQQGEVTVFIYRSKDRYVGVCLELDIVDDSNDRDELLVRMKKNVISYVEYICSKSDFSEHLLNRPAPKKYWNIFFKRLKELQSEKHTQLNKPKKAFRGSARKDFVLVHEQLPKGCFA